MRKGCINGSGGDDNASYDFRKLFKKKPVMSARYQPTFPILFLPRLESGGILGRVGGAETMITTAEGYSRSSSKRSFSSSPSKYASLPGMQEMKVPIPSPRTFPRASSKIMS